MALCGPTCGLPDWPSALRAEVFFPEGPPMASMASLAWAAHVVGVQIVPLAAEVARDVIISTKADRDAIICKKCQQHFYLWLGRLPELSQRAMPGRGYLGEPEPCALSL
jgi:hypothetical protein